MCGPARCAVYLSGDFVGTQIPFEETTPERLVSIGGVYYYFSVPKVSMDVVEVRLRRR